MYPLRGFVSCCLFSLAAGTLPFSIVSGETSRIGTLPRKPGNAALVMTAEMETVAGNGYQPIYLTLSPLGKSFRRDRRLQVVFEPRHYGRTELDFSYRQSVTAVEGSQAVTVSIYVPYYYIWESVTISLLEDGRLIESGQQTFHLGNGLRTRFAFQTTSVGILAPSDPPAGSAATGHRAPWQRYPDVRTLVTVLGDGPLPEDTGVKRLGHQAAIKFAKQVQPAWVQFRPITADKLQDHWLGYSQLDVILVAAPVLEQIEKQQTAKFEHLKHWIAAGGNLWVYAASEQSSDSFLARLDVDPADPNRFLAPRNVVLQLNLQSNNDTSALVYESWGGVYRESQRYSYRSQNALRIRNSVYNELESKKHPFAELSDTTHLARQVQLGSFGLGKVVLIQSPDPFPGSFQFWKSLVNLHENGQLVWTDRMGIDAPKSNDNYWMWLIPSVGQPPVKSFVLLNTLFVVLVGPVCYFFFRKRHRLYLLYFFAPCMALLVTLSLFAYALAADGTKTKVRSRQVTWIDAGSGYAVGQSRQTFYAVLGSGDGIEISGDTAVYPVRKTPAYDRYYRPGTRRAGRGRITVTSAGQLFGGDFLPPRDQVQYLMTRPEKLDQSVELVLSAERRSVTNHLPYTIDHLVACDENRGYWQAADIRPGASTALTPCNPGVLGNLLGADVLPPLDSVPMLQNNQRRRGGPVTGIDVSLLERRLEGWSSRMPPKTFVARAELIDDRLGVEGAVVLDSVHVLMGEIP